jgi:BlaI family transcriptional regulator, penicillinase repressor
MRTAQSTLTPQELAIMKVIWRLGKATVREVHDTLREQREIAYTTVMTMMGVLEKKGHLKKSLVDRAHVFVPVKQQQEVVGNMVRDFVERVFDGASDNLLLALAKDNKLTPKQRRLVKKLIEEIDE